MEDVIDSEDLQDSLRPFTSGIDSFPSPEDLEESLSNARERQLESTTSEEERLGQLTSHHEVVDHENDEFLPTGEDQCLLPSLSREESPGEDDRYCSSSSSNKDRGESSKRDHSTPGEDEDFLPTKDSDQLPNFSPSHEEEDEEESISEGNKT